MSRHPLQRLESPSTGFSSVIHFVGVFSFALTFKYLVDNPTPINQSYGWHFQYLTVVGLALATATFLCGCAADLTGSARLFRYKNTLSICSTPLEVLVTVLYWTISSIDKSLVVPDFAPLSPLADVSFHLFPTLFLTFDFLFLSPPWTSLSPHRTFLTTSIIAFSYWFWVEHCYQHNGWYPYALFAALTPVWRMVLFASSAGLMTLNTIGLKRLWGLVNGDGRGKYGGKAGLKFK